jgi:AcrR family transcriptional regulator
MAVPQAKLRPEDWTHAALAALAEGGISAVAVEPLAARVGASKGSFYWHFSDRAALIEAALAAWEERTSITIRDLQAVADPRQRLRKLFESVFADPVAARLELALALECSHPAVRPVVRRVTSRRLAFVGAALGDLGFDRLEARGRATSVYGTHLGVHALRAAGREFVPGRREDLAAYLDGLLELLARR